MVTALTGIPKIHCGDDAPLSKKLLQSEPAATTGKNKPCFYFFFITSEQCTGEDIQRWADKPDASGPLKMCGFFSMFRIDIGLSRYRNVQTGLI